MKLLKMILYVIMYKIWADCAKRKGLFMKSTAHLKLHKDGSCSIGAAKVGNDVTNDAIDFPWLLPSFWCIVKWWIKELREIRAENRPHWKILSDKLEEIRMSK